MASLYPKERSPFWFLRYRDPKSGKMRNISTKCRRDSDVETRKAKQMRAEYEAKELAQPRIQSGEEWTAWVPGFLAVKYSSSPLSLERAQYAWRSLSAYFRAKAIRSARILSREHCMNYMAWRLSAEALDAGLRKAAHNTALLEVKMLSTIMREAVSRGLAGANPALQLGLKRVRGKVKPEMSDDEIEIIERSLALPIELERPYSEAMRISWEIAQGQVCRLRETCIPLADVDLTEGTITFRIKGGRDHTALLNPDLVPLFQRLKAEGRGRAYVMPNNFHKCWWNFFRRYKLGHLSFHSTRVTGVNRLRRAGVDARIAREFVGHSSVIVNQSYQRIRKAEQSVATDALSSKRRIETQDARPAS